MKLMTKRPRLPPKSERSYFKHSMRCGLLILACCGWVPAHAQSCSDVCELYSDLLLAPERALIGTFRQLERVAKPLMGPRNTRGRWIQRDVYLGKEAFDTTFYLNNGLVQRIELASTAPDEHCRSRTPWSIAITSLEVWHGKDAVRGQFDTSDSVQQSVHWSADDVDISVYLSITAEACSTKIAFKEREVKDASSL